MRPETRHRILSSLHLVRSNHKGRELTGFSYKQHIVTDVLVSF
jgi:hypothetical protein